MLFLCLGLLETEEEKTKFELLYEQYRKLMKYIACGILHDEYLAEDAVHDTFLKLTKYLDSIETVDSPKTKAFIAIITESVCKDMYAKRRREQTTSFDDAASVLIQNDLFLQRDNQTVIASKINQLPEMSRYILILRYLHGYNSKEIADILNLNDGLVRKRLERARRELTVLLREEKNPE
ncbi:MAG: sigma-70 family RNA polymerase sigma factor [Firmicutes bacterium]|nr:sigma-70 family RNA polymerase sigma factor [Bacillota bacterium]